MFSASKRMPAAAKGTMKWALGLLRLEKGISDGLFAAVGLLLVPRGGDGCTPLREGCTKTSSDMEIQLDGKGEPGAPLLPAGSLWVAGSPRGTQRRAWREEMQIQHTRVAHPCRGLEQETYLSPAMQSTCRFGDRSQS